MDLTIRRAHDDDADAISSVILRALRETNAKDYTSENIERIARGFSPDAVRGLIGNRTVFVAMHAGRVVGTASLDGRAVRTVFVNPDVQARGIGKLLMAEIERTARDRSIAALTLSSSITAKNFYAKLGYIAMRDDYHGDERTIVMERRLDEP